MALKTSFKDNIEEEEEEEEEEEATYLPQLYPTSLTGERVDCRRLRQTEAYKYSL